MQQFVKDPLHYICSQIHLLIIFVAPPSLPVCQWDGDIYSGGSVALSCAVAEGVPTPEIHWDKLSPEEISLPINMEGQCHTH